MVKKYIKPELCSKDIKTIESMLAQTSLALGDTEVSGDKALGKHNRFGGWDAEEE